MEAQDPLACLHRGGPNHDNGSMFVSSSRLLAHRVSLLSSWTPEDPGQWQFSLDETCCKVLPSGAILQNARKYISAGGTYGEYRPQPTTIYQSWQSREIVTGMRPIVPCENTTKRARTEHGIRPISLCILHNAYSWLHDENRLMSPKAPPYLAFGTTVTSGQQCLGHFICHQA